jgi:hypothetical protein
MLAGKGAYNDAGFGNSPHRDQVACMNCHGGSAQGKVVGGHSLWMTSDETGDNVAVCVPCHSSATSFDLGGAQTTIEGLLHELEVKLAAFNMLDTTTMLLIPKKYAQADLAVFWNFQLVEADRSNGVHNYLYTYDLLTAGIAHFNGKAN